MAVRTGKEYLAGLADSREIWFEGKRVDSVVDHPILGRMARTLAEIYDLQYDPALQARLTYPSPTTGAPVSLSFIQPRNTEELVRRREMFKHWADFSGGMLGRTPDYLNAILAGCASAQSYFAKNGAEYGMRIAAYYELCREHDFCATHTFVDPQINRARSQSEQKDPSVPLHIVGERSDGLIVSGARMLATLAPYADELHVFPSPLTDAAERRAAVCLCVRAADSDSRLEIHVPRESRCRRHDGGLSAHRRSRKWIRSPCFTVVVSALGAGFFER